MDGTVDDGLGNGELDEAFAWALCLREDLSAETVARFEVWRTASPEADAAWRQVARLWTLAGAALAIAPELLVSPPDDQDPGGDR